MTTAEVSDVLIGAAAALYSVSLIGWALVVAAQTKTGAKAADSTARSARNVKLRELGKAGVLAQITLVLGLLVNVAGVVTRGVAAGRWPTANMYEFTILGVAVMAVVVLVLQRRRFLPFVAMLATGFASVFLLIALMLLHVAADGVQPALQNRWIYIHVGVAIAATGIFTVAFLTVVAQLLQDSRERGTGTLATKRWRVLDQLPSSNVLEALTFRLNASGFVLWTFTLITGAIWAEEAWGRYWNWDPKEVGTFVSWVFYAAYLHARTTRGWAGRRAAWFAIAGFVVVILNFTVINYLVPGNHSYAG